MNSAACQWYIKAICIIDLRLTPSLPSHDAHARKVLAKVNFDPATGSQPYSMELLLVRLRTKFFHHNSTAAAETALDHLHMACIQHCTGCLHIYYMRLLHYLINNL